MAVWDEWDWEKGEKEFLKTLELNPNDALCRIYYAHLLMILRRHEEALQVLTDSWDLRPSYNHEGYLHIQAAEKALVLFPGLKGPTKEDLFFQCLRG